MSTSTTNVREQDSREAGTASREVMVLTAASWSLIAALSVTLAVLPLFLQRTLHLTDTALGLVMGVHALAGVLARPFVGHLAARLGTKWANGVGAGLIIVGACLIAVPVSLPLVMLSRIAMGAGEGIVVVASSATLLRLVPEHKHGKALSLFGLAYWTAMALGPAMGALLKSQFGYSAVWSASALLGCIGITLLWVGVRAAPRSGEAPQTTLMPRRALAPGLALASSAAAYSALPAFGALMLATRGSAREGLPLTCAGTAYVVVRYVGASWPQERGALRVGATSAIIQSVGLIIIALAGVLRFPVSGTLIGAIITGAGTSLIYPSFALLAIRGVAASARANVLGATTAFADLGAASGAGAVGALSAHFGYPVGFVGAASIGIVGALYASFVIRTRWASAETAPDTHAGGASH